MFFFIVADGERPPRLDHDRNDLLWLDLVLNNGRIKNVHVRGHYNLSNSGEKLVNVLSSDVQRSPLPSARGGSDPARVEVASLAWLQPGHTYKLRTRELVLK